MAKLNFKNKWLLVTGASGGLGKEIARYLAFHENANLVISARQTDKLKDLKTEIESACPVKVEIVTADMASPASVDFLFEEAIKRADIYGVINNAGITYFGIADEAHLETFDQIIQVNLKAVMHLSLRFLSYFQGRGEGALLNITSVAGFIPLPYQNVYSATKHATQSFTEALHMENRQPGITICSFAPGGIATDMITRSGLDRKYGLDSPFNMKPHLAARKAVRSFKKKKFYSVPGIINKLTVFFNRFFPRWLVVYLSERTYRL